MTSKKIIITITIALIALALINMFILRKTPTELNKSPVKALKERVAADYATQSNWISLIPERGNDINRSTEASKALDRQEAETQRISAENRVEAFAKQKELESRLLNNVDKENVQSVIEHKQTANNKTSSVSGSGSGEAGGGFAGGGTTTSGGSTTAGGGGGGGSGGGGSGGGGGTGVAGGGSSGGTTGGGSGSSSGGPDTTGSGAGTTGSGSGTTGGAGTTGGGSGTTSSGSDTSSGGSESTGGAFDTPSGILPY